MNDNRPAFQVRNIIVPLLMLLIPVLGYFGWQYKQALDESKPLPENILVGNLKRTTAADKLAERFVDADGDMVADGPKNPADRIDPRELVFCPGIGGPEEPEETWSEFIEHLAKATGKKVTFVAAKRPEDVGNQLAAGAVHVTSFSTGQVPSAVNTGGFVPCVALADAQGNTSYAMEIIVPAKSPVKSPAELRDRKLVLTTASSHSGYKAPLIILEREFQLKPGADYQFVVSGDHVASIKMLGLGFADAAAVANDVLADEVSSGHSLKADQYRSIYKSKTFPKGAWGYSCLLKTELGNQIREAFSNFPFERSKLADRFKGSKSVKFAPVNFKKDWEFVREINAKIRELK